MTEKREKDRILIQWRLQFPKLYPVVKELLYGTKTGLEGAIVRRDLSERNKKEDKSTYRYPKRERNSSNSS